MLDTAQLRFPLRKNTFPGALECNKRFPWNCYSKTKLPQRVVSCEPVTRWVFYPSCKLAFLSAFLLFCLISMKRITFCMTQNNTCKSALQETYKQYIKFLSDA